MGDRVFDVIGQLLQLSNIHFEDVVKEATYSQASEENALEQLEQIDPQRLEALEQATGLALAMSHVNLSGIRRTQSQDFRSEEQRLMPRYIEEFFKRTCEFLNVNLEVRADGLWRVPYVKEEFRSQNLEAVRRLGTVEKNYPKLSFYKEQIANPNHQDAELLSPGHPLFAAIAERLDIELGNSICTSALFLDADADAPYRIYFFEIQVAGQQKTGRASVLKATLVAVLEQASGELVLISPDSDFSRQVLED